MDPHAVLRPVGPQPPGVYWRRRALLLAIVAVVVVAVVWACTGSAGTSPTGAGTQPVSPRPSATSSSSAPAGATDLCRRADLRVSATTDATAYPPGSTPRLSASLTNLGTATCRFNAAASARVWRILSGADEVWSTADCTTTHGTALATIGRGATIRWSMTWDRRRSGQGCTPGADAQPGTYRLYVTIDRIASAGTVFHLR